MARVPFSRRVSLQCCAQSDRAYGEEGSGGRSVRRSGEESLFERVALRRLERDELYYCGTC